MPRDYAARNRKPAAKPAGLPGWVWLVAGLSIGLVVACIVYIGRPAQPMPMATAASANTKVAKVAVEIPPKVDSRFDFYDILENEEVVVPGEARPRTPPTTAPPKPPAVATPTPPAPSGTVAVAPPPTAPPAASSTTSKQYLVLAGSFREPRYADEHKARLAMAGIEANIERVTTQEGLALHRVRVGPSSSLPQAERVVAQLKSMGVDGRVITVK